MESLAYLYNAAAYESNEPMPQLRQFDTLGSVLPNSAWISIQSLLAAVLAISVAHSALAAATGIVSTSGNPLNVRSAPNGGVVGSVPDGSRIELTGRNQDGFLELTNGTWVATEWISTSTATPNKSPATPSTSASPTRPPTGAVDRTVAYIATAGEAINVRTAPGGQVVGTLPNGTRVELTGRDSQGYLERTNATWLDKRYVSANQPSVQPAPVKAAPLRSPQVSANQPSVQPSPTKIAPQASPQAATSQPAPVQVAVNRAAQTVGYVRTTGNPLNVRNAPGGQVISTLPNGTRLELTGRENAGYLERSNGTWLDQRYVAYTPLSTNQAASPLPSPSQTRSVQSPPLTTRPSPAVSPSPAATRPSPSTVAASPAPANATSAGSTPGSTVGRSSATVRTSGDPLNVRSAPGGAVVGTIPNSSRVDLTGRRSGEWAERSDGTWVSSAWLTINPATSPTPPQAQPPVNANPVGSNISTAVIRTNGSSLNVRSSPGGALVGSVPNGSRVDLTGRRSGEWAERSDGTWVSSTWFVSATGTTPTTGNNPASGNAVNSTLPVGGDVTSGTIRTNGNPLNVRTSPNGAVIGVVANGSRVELTGRNSGEWVQLSQGGWVASDWVVR